MLSIPGTALLLLSAFTIPLVQTGFISSLPQCIQNCIDESQDDNCSVTDVACLCRASSGNFLPDLITCTSRNCDDDLDLLLTPLQIVCEIAGAPIPDSAIQSAQSQVSSLYAPATTTVIVGGSSATGGLEATTTVSTIVMKSSVSTKTVTKTEDGSTIYVVYPITVGSTTTVSGKPSTITSKLTSRHSTRESSSVTTSGSVSSTTTLTTSVEAAETSSVASPSSRTSTRKPETTNSSPFTTTNGNGASKESLGSLLGFSVFLMACCLWY